MYSVEYHLYKYSTSKCRTWHWSILQLLCLADSQISFRFLFASTSTMKPTLLFRNRTNDWWTKQQVSTCFPSSNQTPQVIEWVKSILKKSNHQQPTYPIHRSAGFIHLIYGWFRPECHLPCQHRPGWTPKVSWCLTFVPWNCQIDGSQTRVDHADDPIHDSNTRDDYEATTSFKIV